MNTAVPKFAVLSTPKDEGATGESEGYPKIRYFDLLPDHLRPQTRAQLTRAETLEVLTSVGIDIAPKTKLSDGELDARLEQLLGALQRLPKLVGSGKGTVDPRVLRQLPGPVPGELPICEAFCGADVHEHRVHRPEHDCDDAFFTLRKKIIGFAKVFDRTQYLVLQDAAEEEWTFCIRLLSVHELAQDGTPVIVVLYHFTTNTPYTREVAHEWFSDWANVEPKPPHGFTTLTELEMKLLNRILEMNARFLPADFEVHKKDTEEHFAASFFLPLSPLDFEQHAKLNPDSGCVVCSNAASSRCGQCQTVSYCGAACQREDWADHKKLCRTLKGGTWRTVRFINSLPGTEGMWARRVKADGTTWMFQEHDNVVPPPNIHNTRAFLVKIQLGCGKPVPDQMYIYDRQRSNECYIEADSNVQEFAQLKREMEVVRPGYSGIKMYRYARRVGEWELSICLDRPPAREDECW